MSETLISENDNRKRPPKTNEQVADQIQRITEMMARRADSLVRVADTSLVDLEGSNGSSQTMVLRTASNESAEVLLKTDGFMVEGEEVNHYISAKDFADTENQGQSFSLNAWDRVEIGSDDSLQGKIEEILIEPVYNGGKKTVPNAVELTATQETWFSRHSGDDSETTENPESITETTKTTEASDDPETIAVAAAGILGNIRDGLARAEREQKRKKAEKEKRIKDNAMRIVTMASSIRGDKPSVSDKDPRNFEGLGLISYD